MEYLRGQKTFRAYPIKQRYKEMGRVISDIWWAYLKRAEKSVLSTYRET